MLRVEIAPLNRRSFENAPLASGRWNIVALRTPTSIHGLNHVGDRLAFPAFTMWRHGLTELLRIKRLGFFGGLVAEGAGFVDLGGQFLNPRHHSLLFRQRRQRDFITEHMRRANCCVVRRTLRCDLFAKRGSANEEIEKTAVEFRFINSEQKIVAADDCAVERWRHNPKATDFRVNFCDQEFASATNLLRLRLDQCPWDFVAKHYALNVKLDAWAFVSREVINPDELFPMSQDFPKLHDWPQFCHL